MFYYFVPPDYLQYALIYKMTFHFITNAPMIQDNSTLNDKETITKLTMICTGR